MKGSGRGLCVVVGVKKSFSDSKGQAISTQKYKPSILQNFWGWKATRNFYRRRTSRPEIGDKQIQCHD